MKHNDTYSAHPVVHTLDTMSISMKIVGADNHFFYEIDSFSCLLSDEDNVCTIIVHSQI